MSKRYTILVKKLEELETGLVQLLCHLPADDETSSSYSNNLSRDIEQKLEFLKNLLSTELLTSASNQNPSRRPADDRSLRNSLAHISQRLAQLESSLRQWQSRNSDVNLLIPNNNNNNNINEEEEEDVGSTCSCCMEGINSFDDIDGEINDKSALVLVGPQKEEIYEDDDQTVWVDNDHHEPADQTVRVDESTDDDDDDDRTVESDDDAETSGPGGLRRIWLSLKNHLAMGCGMIIGAALAVLTFSSSSNCYYLDDVFGDDLGFLTPT